MKMAEVLKARGILDELTGNVDAVIHGISAVEDCGPGDLIFVDKKEYLPLLADRRPTAVITNRKLKDFFSQHQGMAVMISPNVSLAHAIMKTAYSARDFNQSGWEGVHPSSVMHPSATVGGGDSLGT